MITFVIDGLARRGARWILHDAISDGKGADAGPGAMTAQTAGSYFHHTHAALTPLGQFTGEAG
jgi:hypothetical protein